MSEDDLNKQTEGEIDCNPSTKTAINESLKDEKSSTDEGSSEDGSSGDESSGDDGDEGEDEEVEPRLNYSFQRQLPEMLFRDAISMVLATNRFVAYATHTGVVHLCTPDNKPLRTYRAHSASILDLSSNLDEEFIASASLDGTIIVASIIDQKDTTKVTLLRPVHSVALEPEFKASRSIVCGTTAGQVILSEKDWLGRRTQSILFESPLATDGSGDTIKCLQWLNSSIIVWICANGFYFYDMAKRVIVTRLDHELDMQSAEMFRPRVARLDFNHLAIGWVNSIWLIKVVYPDSNANSSKFRLAGVATAASSIGSGAPQVEVDVVMKQTEEYTISGVAPFEEGGIMVLTLNQEEKGLEIKLLDAEAKEYYEDLVFMKDKSPILRPDDYHLAWNGEGSTKSFFIVGATDVIVSTPRDRNDHVQWLLEHEQYETLWRSGVSILDPINRMTVGLKAVKINLKCSKSIQDDERAVGLLQQVLEPLAESYADIFRQEWDSWAKSLLENSKELLLIRAIPFDPKYGISKQIYDELLAWAIRTDTSILLMILKKWPIASLCNVEKMLNALEDYLDEASQLDTNEIADQVEIERLVGLLYIECNNPIAGIRHHLLAKDPLAIDEIQQYHLLPQLRDQIGRILTYLVDEKLLSKKNIHSDDVHSLRDQSKRAVELLVAARHQVLPADVIESVKNYGRLQKSNMEPLVLLYLDAMVEEDQFICRDYADMQVALYASYETQKLMKFLRTTSNYDPRKAIAVCEQHRNACLKELIYLLGKVGQSQRAMNLIMNELDDVELAVEFATMQNDSELWEDLLDHSAKDARYTRVLLECGNSHIDPVNILRRISRNSQVPGLRDTLDKIFRDKILLQSLDSHALQAVSEMAQGFASEFRALKLQGTGIDPETARDYRTTAEINWSEIVLARTRQPNEQAEFQTIKSSWSDFSTSYDQSTATVSIGAKIRHLAWILTNLVSMARD